MSDLRSIERTAVDLRLELAQLVDAAQDLTRYLCPPGLSGYDTARPWPPGLTSDPTTPRREANHWGKRAAA